MTNETILQRIVKDLEFLKQVKHRKILYFGHIMRTYPAKIQGNRLAETAAFYGVIYVSSKQSNMVPCDRKHARRIGTYRRKRRKYENTSWKRGLTERPAAEVR